MIQDKLFDMYELALKNPSNDGFTINEINNTYNELNEEIKVNKLLKEKLTQPDNNGTLCVWQDDDGYWMHIAFMSINEYGQHTLNVLPFKIPKEQYELLSKWIKK